MNTEITSAVRKLGIDRSLSMIEKGILNDPVFRCQTDYLKGLELVCRFGEVHAFRFENLGNLFCFLGIDEQKHNATEKTLEFSCDQNAVKKLYRRDYELLETLRYRLEQN
jgi:hypothetical protein